MEILYELTDRLTRLRDRDELLEDAMDVCCEMLRFERSAIAVKQTKGNLVDWPVVRNLRGREGELTVSRTILSRALVQDVMTAVTYFRTRFNTTDMVLVCAEGAGPWCLMAASLVGPDLPLVADMGKFDPTDDNEFVAKLFIPGIRRAGDFRAAAVLRAGGKTTLHNVSPQFPQAWFDASFAAAAGLESLNVRDEPFSAEELVAALPQ